MGEKRNHSKIKTSQNFKKREFDWQQSKTNLRATITKSSREIKTVVMTSINFTIYSSSNELFFTNKTIRIVYAEDEAPLPLSEQ